MRKHTIYTLLLIMLFIFSGCNSHSKEQKISEAFTKRSQKNLNQLEKVKKDITPPYYHFPISWTNIYRKSNYRFR